MHTTLLTQAEAKKLGIVTMPDGSDPRGWRRTTYDSQTGEIITSKGVWKKGQWIGKTYPLKPREIVWIISSEDYCIPEDVTGITTLKTGLTKQGILTLTVGVVDPGYQGPLSTAIINFSGKTFNLQEGDVFFRTAFFKHQNAPAENAESSEPAPKAFNDNRVEIRNKYRKEVIKSTSVFSESFLTINTLASELAPKILGIPRFIIWITVLLSGAAILLAAIGLIATPLWATSTRYEDISVKIRSLEAELDALQSRSSSPPLEPSTPQRAEPATPED